MKNNRYFLLVSFFFLFILFQFGCSDRQPSQLSSQPTSDIFLMATQSAVPATPTIEPLPSPTNSINVSRAACFGKGLALRSVWSPDGKVFAVGGSFGVYLYDGATYQELRFLATEIYAQSMAFSPDSKLLVVGDSEFLQVWDIDAIQLLYTHKAPFLSGLLSIVFTPDERILVASGSQAHHSVVIWDGKTGEQLHKIPGTEPIISIAFVANGKDLMVSRVNHQVSFWNTDSGLLDNMSTKSIAQAVLSPDQSTLALIDNGDQKSENDSVFELLDFDTWKVLKSIPIQSDDALGVVFDPDGKPLGLSRTQDTIRLWDINSNIILQTFPIGLGRKRWTGAYSPNGKSFAIMSSEDVSIWDIATGQQVAVLSGFTNSVSGVVFSPDGQLLANSIFGGLIVRDLNTHNILYSATLADTQDITSIAFSPSGQNLVVERYDPKDFHRAIQILDARTGKSVYDFPEGISSVLYSPNGQTLAVVNATLLQVLNSANNQVLYTLNDSNAYIQDVDFSPDGRILVTSRKDENIKFWDTANGQLIREISEKSEHFAFHPNGHQFAVAMENGFELIEIETGTILWKATSEYVTSVLFSPDGQKVFSRGGDGVVKMWNSDNGQHLSTFNSWELGIVSLSIHPEGHLLATGSYDGRVCLWELPRE